MIQTANKILRIKASFMRRHQAKEKKLNGAYQIIQFDYIVILGLKQPVRVTFLGRVGLEESQNVLCNVANNAGREFAIGA